MLEFSVREELCGRCRMCVLDCPARIIEQEGDALPCIQPEREAHCLKCQHCLAVCPHGAISILGKDPEASLPLTPEGLPTLAQMTRLVRGRRSIRHYRDENVDSKLLGDILATLANVPTGCNQRELTFSVIDDKTTMKHLRDRLYSSLASGAIAEDAQYLKEAVRPWYDGGHDMIFRGAPHALIVSAPADAPCPQQDVALALAYFELLAQSAGLGTVWWGMLQRVLEVLPHLKNVLGLPADHVYYAMLFGVPAVRFSRTVQRDDAAVIRRVIL